MLVNLIFIEGFSVNDLKIEDTGKVDKSGNPILPVNDWDLICRESYSELESIIKLREDLSAAENSLRAKVKNNNLILYKFFRN